MKYSLKLLLLLTISSIILINSQEKTDDSLKFLEENDSSPNLHFTSTSTGEEIGWSSKGKVGNGWCAGEIPQDWWTLKNTCPPSKRTSVKILTYNLFWWNLFGQRKGNGGSAGKLISKYSNDKKFDFIGFQESEDISRVLGDAGLSQYYDTFQGGHAVNIGWLKSTWEKLKAGTTDVAEDTKAQWYGRRIAVWGRFRNKQTGQNAFFMNHHGPLPVGTGGMCGGYSVAYNMLKVIGLNAHKGDLIVIVGDFNSNAHSETVRTLGSKISNTYTGSSFGGVDQFFSNVQMVYQKNMGDGGSDHDALMGVFEF